MPLISRLTFTDQIYKSLFEYFYYNSSSEIEQGISLAMMMLTCYKVAYKNLTDSCSLFRSNSELLVNPMF